MTNRWTGTRGSADFSQYRKQKASTRLCPARSELHGRKMSLADHRLTDEEIELELTDEEIEATTKKNKKKRKKRGGHPAAGRDNP